MNLIETGEAFSPRATILGNQCKDNTVQGCCASVLLIFAAVVTIVLKLDASVFS